MKAKIEAALKLLEAGWCQHDYAQDKDGKAVPPEHPTAVCFCASGALQRVNTVDGVFDSESFSACTDLVRPGVQILSWWNDRPERTKEEVLDLFRKAL